MTETRGQELKRIDNYAMFKKGSESDIKEGDTKDSKEYVRASVAYHGRSDCLTRVFAIAKVG